MTRVDSPRRRQVVGASLLVPGLLVFDWVLFRFVLGTDYVAWYLANGALIALGTAFVSGLSKNIEDLGRPLVSAHPLRYYGACLQVTGLVLFALGISVKSPPGGHQLGDGGVRAIAAFLDTVANLFVHLAVFGLVVAWVLFVAPANYLVTLVSGAPARESLRHPNKRLVGVVGRPLPDRDASLSVVLSPGQRMHVYETGTTDVPAPLTEEELRESSTADDAQQSSMVDDVRESSTDAGPTTPPTAHTREVHDLSFASNPFGITQALTGLVLFALGLFV